MAKAKKQEAGKADGAAAAGGGEEGGEGRMAMIRAAVQKNRGGWEQSTDEELLVLWRSLHEEVRQQYLDSLQENGKGG